MLWCSFCICLQVVPLLTVTNSRLASYSATLPGISTDDPSPTGPPPSPEHLPHPLSSHPPHLVHPQSVKDVIDLALLLGEEDEVVDVGEHVQLTLKAKHRRRIMIGSVHYLELSGNVLGPEGSVTSLIDCFRLLLPSTYIDELLVAKISCWSKLTCMLTSKEQPKMTEVDLFQLSRRNCLLLLQ